MFSPSIFINHGILLREQLVQIIRLSIKQTQTERIWIQLVLVHVPVLAMAVLCLIL
jgi:hypothetical protein